MTIKHTVLCKEHYILFVNIISMDQSGIILHSSPSVIIMAEHTVQMIMLIMQH